MGKTLETINTLNNFLRTLLAAVVMGVITVAGWFGYNTYYAGEIRAKKLADAQAELDQSKLQIAEQRQLLADREKEISHLNDEIHIRDEKIVRLDTSLRLLKVDHRVADIRVLEQGTDEKTDQRFTRISFQEVNDEGVAIGEPKQFRIEGDMVYVDHWVVKFDDKYVEENDLDRSTSIVLFRRIFGEEQKPSEGYELDETGTAPTAYTRGGKTSDFEKQIWGDFWNIANDSKRATELGIRAIHGDAVNMRLKPEKTYRLELRASGGISIRPMEDAAPSEAAKL